jgi:hypothetical protein
LKPRMDTNQHEFAVTQTWESALQFLSLCVIVVIASGCRVAEASNTRVPAPQMLLSMERGISQERLETLLGVPAKHEFTVSQEHTLIRCVSYYFVADDFVLTNNALEKIIQPPRFEHELSPWELGKRAVWKSYDPLERMEVVRRAPDLDRQGIQTAMEHRHKPKTVDNALPGAIIAGIIAAPVTIAQAPQRAAENQEIKLLSERFSAFRVHLEMSVTEVEQMLGSPYLSEKRDDGCEIRYYGSPKLGVQNRLLWVSVSFKEEKAIQVFSNDFFDYHKIENIVKDRR